MTPGAAWTDRHSQSGAGWQPAADCQSASRSFRFITRRPIDNRPQAASPPHFGSCRFPPPDRKSRRLARTHEWAPQAVWPLGVVVLAPVAEDYLVVVTVAPPPVVPLVVALES